MVWWELKGMREMEKGIDETSPLITLVEGIYGEPWW
jgi:hypothetical protein